MFIYVRNYTSRFFFDLFLRPTDKGTTRQGGITEDGISWTADNGVSCLNNISGNLHSL
jgi:hypothetical protein